MSMRLLCGVLPARQSHHFSSSCWVLESTRCRHVKNIVKQNLRESLPHEANLTENRVDFTLRASRCLRPWQMPAVGLSWWWASRGSFRKGGAFPEHIPERCWTKHAHLHALGRENLLNAESETRVCAAPQAVGMGNKCSHLKSWSSGLRSESSVPADGLQFCLYGLGVSIHRHVTRL